MPAKFGLSLVAVSEAMWYVVGVVCRLICISLQSLGDCQSDVRVGVDFLQVGEDVGDVVCGEFLVHWAVK